MSQRSSNGSSSAKKRDRSPCEQDVVVIDVDEDDDDDVTIVSSSPPPPLRPPSSSSTTSLTAERRSSSSSLQTPPPTRRIPPVDRLLNPQHNESDSGETIYDKLDAIKAKLSHYAASQLGSRPSSNDTRTPTPSSTPATATSSSGTLVGSPLLAATPPSSLPPPVSSSAIDDVEAAAAAPPSWAFVPVMAAERSLFVKSLSPAVVHRRHWLQQKGIWIRRLTEASYVTDAGSVFVSYVAHHPQLTEEDAKHVAAEIAADATASRAAHPAIYAYRCMPPGALPPASADNIRAVEGKYDNGEQYAGEKILRVLQSHRLTGVVVVVSRWFGGVLLGPRRFTHIETVTRRILVAHGLIVERMEDAENGGALP